MEFEQALGIVRLMINGGITREVAISNPAIPTEHRDRIRETLEQEETIILEPAKMLVANAQRGEWLTQLDRSSWYYWPKLREYLLGLKNRSEPAVRSLDETTDRILGQLAPPSTGQFDIRGLVVGYVQSGKTENYTALIAKAADVGYRLVIVLSGIDNGLRRQTQIRLKNELVGYPDNRQYAVRLPPSGKQWHQFTNEEFNGDFQPGFANDAALQGTQPVLLVVKKNGAVLRRLHRYLDLAQDSVKQNLPVLVIDDEADQASIDTRGSYLEEDEPVPDDYEEPTVINGLIRDLLNKFTKITYVAYTATPFANILIPHDTYDPSRKNDLYPRDFIVDLPKPIDYFGAEELFGRFDPDTEEDVGGLDVIRHVNEQDMVDLKHGMLPASLEMAMVDFVLAGACRAYRRQGGNFPATMLIHGSHLIQPQLELEKLVSRRYAELKDEWRYQRKHGFREHLKERWNQEFRPRLYPHELEPDISFEMIEAHVGRFFESVYVRVINSSRSGEILDYEREPDLKAIAIGGNRLSRGLTLEGLLVSYFVRSSATYDALMQMGRWFGFRSGYEDLTRIYMTEELSGWFRDLALVEYELRQDIRVYEVENLTPLQIGTRILRHPAMLVTSRLKQRFGQTITVEQSYSNRSMETIRFPFQRLDDLSILLNENLAATKTFLLKLGAPSWDTQGAIWTDISSENILNFLNSYRLDKEVKNISLPLVSAYIQRQNENEELTKWTVAVRGLKSTDPKLGEIDFELGKCISLNGRTRISDSNSLGSISNPEDEGIGLTKAQLDDIEELMASSEKNIGFRAAARSVRLPVEGLIIVYPISRFSGYDKKNVGLRKPIYDNPNDPLAQDIIGIYLSFPRSDKAEVVLGQYVVGTVGWRVYEPD